MGEWFEDWFNTDEYLEVYQHRNEADARELVQLILKSVNLSKNASVLDLACGAGRHSIFFAKRGYKVTAVDLSDNLLRVAKKSAERNKVSIDFLKADLRHFSTNRNFDLIVNLFTSFGYFESDAENLKLFETVDKYLNPAGYFVLDYLNKTFIENNLVKESRDNLKHCSLVQKRHFEKNRVTKDIYINRNGTIAHYKESVRMFSREELISAIGKAGMKIRNIFGGFKSEEFDEMNSQRIIIIAQK
jgi:cyclopropane fatty-acyl-phospholipid synthase-like methyltransferase